MYLYVPTSYLSESFFHVYHSMFCINILCSIYKFCFLFTLFYVLYKGFVTKLQVPVYLFKYYYYVTVNDYVSVVCSSCQNVVFLYISECVYMIMLKCLLLFVFSCTDINECHRRGRCQHSCQNTPGSFRCTCPQGYRLATNGRTCQGKYCLDTSNQWQNVSG